MKFSISPRLTLLVIASMFLLPLLLAWLMYSGSLSFDAGTSRNLGTLVVPPVPIDWKQAQTVQSIETNTSTDNEVADILLEHWVILYPLPVDCDEPCRQHVSSLRQIHLAAGRHQSRIRLALVLDETDSKEISGSLTGVYEKFVLIRDPAGSLESALNGIGADVVADMPKPGPRTYLIDPLGNIMMYYGPDADPNHIRLDLKRLLTWSKLDEQ